MKVDWNISPDRFFTWARSIADEATEILSSQGIIDTRTFEGSIEELDLRRLSPEAAKLLIKDSISPIPLHKTLVLLDCLNLHRNDCYYKYGLLALGNVLVFSISNLRFGPEVELHK